MSLKVHAIQVRTVMKDDNPLVVFSGDAFSPSLLSSITKGSHMPPILSYIGVKVACIGNHDFDYGTETLKKLIKQCSFPWLMANVLDRKTSKGLQYALMKIEVFSISINLHLCRKAICRCSCHLHN
jgi:2',3'-cyclic-nucleotide 2'-phosphodiesterase (5'-nucleotidase family)